MSKISREPQHGPAILFEDMFCAKDKRKNTPVTGDRREKCWMDARGKGLQKAGWQSFQLHKSSLIGLVHPL
jgi:hypothetical protein